MCAGVSSPLCAQHAPKKPPLVDPEMRMKLVSSTVFKYVLIKCVSNGDTKTILRGYAWGEFHDGISQPHKAILLAAQLSTRCYHPLSHPPPFQTSSRRLPSTWSFRTYNANASGVLSPFKYTTEAHHSTFFRLSATKHPPPPSQRLSPAVPVAHTRLIPVA